MTDLLPCPLCNSTDVQPGVCYVGDSPEREDAARCGACGCRATKKAWQARGAAQRPLDASLFDAMQIELTDGHLALDRLGAPREIQDRECLVAERISHLAQIAPNPAKYWQDMYTDLLKRADAGEFAQAPIEPAIELAYGLLWIVGCNRDTKDGQALYLARKALYEQLDKNGQARGITAARAALSVPSTDREIVKTVAQGSAKSAMTAQGALDIAANIAESIDSGRGNEKEIARAIRRVAKDGYWTRDGSLVPSTLRACLPLNKETRCDACNLLAPCSDPSCPNALSSTPSATPVMQAAENAAKVVEGWSDSKKEYADRVVSPAHQLPPGEVR